MKTFTLFTLLFLSIPFAAPAQVNTYFQHNPEWVVMRGNGVFYPCIEWDSANYYINGDSIFHSLTYKKLWKCGHKWYSWQSPNPNTGCSGNFTYCDTMITGLVRSQGLQMYFIPQNDTNEYLLYDFNLVVGSQLPQTYTYCCPGGETVTQIDSIYTPYGYRKRFFINNSTSQWLVEGIGSNYGFIEPWGPQLDQAYSFYCYGLNDTAYYPQMGPSCSVITSFPPGQKQENELLLVPNPANDYVEIKSVGLQPESITVYDVFGRVVKQEAANTKLFVGDLPGGLYTVVIMSAQGCVSRKLIIE